MLVRSSVMRGGVFTSHFLARSHTLKIARQAAMGTESLFSCAFILWEVESEGWMDGWRVEKRRWKLRGWGGLVN